MVDPRLFADYRRALEAVAELCHSSVRDILDQMPAMGERQAAAMLLGRYPELLARFGAMSAEVAREYYQSARDAYFEGDDEAEAYEARSARTIPPEWATEDVRAAASGERGMSVGMLPGKAAKRVMERADRTIIQNASRDPAHPKWAVVPRPDACAWCVMVGSRGFVYRSELTADAQRHANCRCAVCVDFDVENPSLEGYDPDALYDRYREDLANGTVTTSGSSIASIGLRSGGGAAVVPRARSGGGAGGRERERIRDWTNDAIASFEAVRDAGQLKALADRVNETWARGGEAFTDRQVQGVKWAFDRARKRLEDDANVRGLGSRETDVALPEAGGAYGAWNESNDPDGRKRGHHAIRFYEELRNRDEDAEVKRTSDNTGIGEAVVRQAYRHIFVEKHDLDKGHNFFDENYDMAESWRRMSTGVDIQPHDLTLVYHEAIEDDFMYMRGLPYRAAHDMTCDMGYDWAKECDEWKRANGLL